MSKESSGWDKLWSEYNKALQTWMQAFDLLQKAGTEMQTKYGEVMAKALNESNQTTLSQFSENWQKTMSQAGLNAFKQFGENWQNMLHQSGMDQLKTYGEMMNKFAETWSKMWRS